MQADLKKEIQIKFKVDNRDALEALNLLGKEYSGLADKSAKIVSGNNEVSKSLKGITAASQAVNQTPGSVNNKNTGIYETDKKKYKELNGLAVQYSKSIQKLDEEDNFHKIRTTSRMLKSVGALLAQHTTAYKAFVSSSTIMDTYQAAEAAYKSAAEIPLVGFILAPAVAAAATIAGMQRVNQINATTVPGYAKGGAVVGENGPEIIAPFQDYAAGQAKLITMTMMALKTELNNRNSFNAAPAGNSDLINEVKTLNKNFEKYSQNPVAARAYLDDREAKKIFSRGYAIDRKSKI
jgi:hypothetical protein